MSMNAQRRSNRGIINAAVSLAALLLLVCVSCVRGNASPVEAAYGAKVKFKEGRALRFPVRAHLQRTPPSDTTSISARLVGVRFQGQRPWERTNRKLVRWHRRHRSCPVQRGRRSLSDRTRPFCQTRPVNRGRTGCLDCKVSDETRIGSVLRSRRALAAAILLSDWVGTTPTIAEE